MYAVIETGGKQYRVEVGTELEVERLAVEPGQAITLERVLLVADGADTSIGRPLVADAVVSAEVVRQDRGDKVIAFKYRPKARRRVKKGHRQELTVLRITDVRLGGRSAAEEVREAKDREQTERERLDRAAARQAAADADLAAKLAGQAPASADTATPSRGRGRSAGAGSEAPAKAPAKDAKAPKTTAKPARATGTTPTRRTQAPAPQKSSGPAAKSTRSDAKPAKAGADSKA